MAYQPSLKVPIQDLILGPYGTQPGQMDQTDSGMPQGGMPPQGVLPPSMNANLSQDLLGSGLSRPQLENDTKNMVADNSKKAQVSASNRKKARQARSKMKKAQGPKESKVLTWAKRRYGIDMMLGEDKKKARNEMAALKARFDESQKKSGDWGLQREGIAWSDVLGANAPTRNYARVMPIKMFPQEIQDQIQGDYYTQLAGANGYSPIGIHRDKLTDYGKEQYDKILAQYYMRNDQLAAQGEVGKMQRLP